MPRSGSSASPKSEGRVTRTLDDVRSGRRGIDGSLFSTEGTRSMATYGIIIGIKKMMMTRACPA